MFVDQTKPVVFLHIPKTGGVSIRNLLTMKYSEDEILWIKGQDLSQIDFTDKKLITGHFMYDRIISRCSVNPIIITVIRKPVDRVLSTYYYFKSLRKAKNTLVLGNHESAKKISKMSLKEFITSNDPNIIWHRDNLQVRLLTASCNENREKIIGSESIELAKERINNIFFIGITENMFESVAMLSNIFNIPFPGKIPWLNPTEKRKCIEEVNPKLIHLLSKKNTLDNELYESAKELFTLRYSQWVSEINDRYYRGWLKKQPLQDYVRLDFSKKINGWGWYSPVNNAFRWSGPTTESFIDIRIAAKHPLDLRFMIDPSFNRDLVEKLSVIVNGHPILVKYEEIEDGKVLYKGRIPEISIMNDENFLRIVFQLPTNRRPSDVLSDNLDTNDYGFAYYWLEVKPA